MADPAIQRRIQVNELVLQPIESLICHRHGCVDPCPLFDHPGHPQFRRQGFIELPYRRHPPLLERAIEADDVLARILSQFVSQLRSVREPLLGGNCGTEHVLILRTVATVAYGGKYPAWLIDERQLSSPPILDSGNFVDDSPPPLAWNMVRPVRFDQ